MIREVKWEKEISLPPALAPGGCYFRDRSSFASEVDDNATRHPFAAAGREHITSCLAIFRPWQKIEFGQNGRPRNSTLVHHGIHRRHSPVTARNGRKIDHINSPRSDNTGRRLNIFHNEIFLAFVHRQHIGHHLSRNRQRGPVPVASFLFSFVYHGQLRIPSRREFGGPYQHGLQMFVPLFRDRPTLIFTRRLLLGAGQATVAHGLASRRKTPRISNTQVKANTSPTPGIVINRSTLSRINPWCRNKLKRRFCILVNVSRLIRLILSMSVTKSGTSSSRSSKS